jgi:hypothetical protein
MFNKSYDKIIKGFTKVSKELRQLENDQVKKAIGIGNVIDALELEQDAAFNEATRSAKTAIKLEALFEDDEGVLKGEITDA